MGAGRDEARDIDAALRTVEELIEKLDRLDDPAAREPAQKLVAMILDLHGVALARLMAVVATADGGASLLARLAEDDQVRPLLLLHGLHPEDTETRVRRAAERLTPHLGVHGFRLEVINVSKGTARLKLVTGDGSAAKAPMLMTLPIEIEGAIVEAAPDIDEVVIEGLGLANTAAAGRVSSKA